MRVGKVMHSLHDLSGNLTKSTQDMASYYNSLVEDLDNVDELKAQPMLDNCQVSEGFSAVMRQRRD